MKRAMKLSISDSLSEALANHGRGRWSEAERLYGKVLEHRRTILAYFTYPAFWRCRRGKPRVAVERILRATEFARVMPIFIISPWGRGSCLSGLRSDALPRRADPKFSAILGDEPPIAWTNEMAQAFMRAFPLLNEIVFFHRKARTLIFTVRIFNIVRRDSAYGRFLLRLDGAFHRPAIPHSFRLLLRRKRPECAAFLNRLLLWDFDRVILAHGEIIDYGAKSAVERVWRFA